MNHLLRGALLCVFGFMSVLISVQEVKAQNVGISTSTITPDGSSILELRSTDGGFLMPRMTETQRDAISTPATGLIIYQTDNSPGYYFYNGSVWGPIEGIDNLGNHRYTQNMETDGNWLSNDGDSEGIYVEINGDVGVGTSTPDAALHVQDESSSNPFLIKNVKNSNASGELIGVGFGSQINSDVVKSGLIHERLNANGRGKLHLVVDGSSDANDVGLSDSRLTIDQLGNVGIGTSSPSELLDVSGKTLTQTLQVSTGATTGHVLTSDASGNATWQPATGGGTDNLGDHTATQNIITDGNWMSNDGDNEGLFVTTDGDVGIGVSSPASPFEVAGNGSSDDLMIRAVKYSNTASELVGIGFGSQTGSDVAKSAVVHERESAWGVGKLHFLVDNVTDNSDVTISESRMTIDRNGLVGIGTTAPTHSLHVEGDVRIQDGGYIDDDATVAGNNDDWLRLNGYIEMKSNSDNYGLVIRDKDNSEYLGITQKNGWSYFSDNQASGSYFLRGSGANAETRGDLTVRGGDIRDNSGTLKLSGEDDLYLTMDYNNNDAGTRSIRFGKDNQANPTELMRLSEDGDLGIGTSTPAEKLHVEGNGQVSGYMKVGNPASPQSSQSGQEVTIFGWSTDMAYSGWTRSSTCGSASDWVWVHDNSFPDYPNYFEFDNAGSYSRMHLHSPWMYIPTGASTIRVEAQFDCTLENNYDGVFMEYTTDGTTWTKIDSYSYHGYPDNADGANTSCSGTNNQSCWNGNLSNYSCWTNSLAGSLSGTWVGFRLTGFEDASVGSGDFRLYGFSVSANMPGGLGGSFAAGNVYAENNVYAGSNVLLGDVAEYFPVNGTSEAGDVISISKGGRGEAYVVSSRAYDD